LGFNAATTPGPDVVCTQGTKPKNILVLKINPIREKATTFIILGVLIPSKVWKY